MPVPARAIALPFALLDIPALSEAADRSPRGRGWRRQPLPCRAKASIRRPGLRDLPWARGCYRLARSFGWKEVFRKFSRDHFLGVEARPTKADRVYAARGSRARSDGWSGERPDL